LKEGQKRLPEWGKKTKKDMGKGKGSKKIVTEDAASELVGVLGRDHEKRGEGGGGG